MNQFYFLAQYNCDAYGVNAYGECATSTTTPSANANGLSSTGYDVLLPIALGIALLIAGAILFFKKLRRRLQKQNANDL
jgi:LPXTG-motif cell wall-anchored protein